MLQCSDAFCRRHKISLTGNRTDRHRQPLRCATRVRSFLPGVPVDNESSGPFRRRRIRGFRLVREGGGTGRNNCFEIHSVISKNCNLCEIAIEYEVIIFECKLFYRSSNG